MNALVFSSIQSAAYQNRFECLTRTAGEYELVFSSMSHEQQVCVADDGMTLVFIPLLNKRGMQREFSAYAYGEGLVIHHPKNDMTGYALVLGAMFSAAARIPNDEGVVVPDVTECETVIKTRLGQHRYKAQQEMLWGGACAVTGIKEPALLRASHAKPWCDSSDSERIDPANGLTLSVHLDALFDAGLISFAEDGVMLLSNELDATTIDIYGLSSSLRLRHIPSAAQNYYLAYHRAHVFKS